MRFKEITHCAKCDGEMKSMEGLCCFQSVVVVISHFTTIRDRSKSNVFSPCMIHGQCALNAACFTKKKLLNRYLKFREVR